MNEPIDRFDKETDEILRKIYKVSSGQELERVLKERLRRKYGTLNDAELKEKIREEIEEELMHQVKKKYEGLSDGDLDWTIEHELNENARMGHTSISDDLKERMREKARRKYNLESRLGEEREKMKRDVIIAENSHEYKRREDKNLHYMDADKYTRNYAISLLALLSLIGGFYLFKEIDPTYNISKQISQIIAPKKAVVSEKKEECDVSAIYKEIEQFGKDWKNSECSEYNDEEFSEEMLKKATYDKIKLRFKYTDGISTDLYFPNSMVKETEIIPDQIQAALNLNDLLTIFCDRDKEGTFFSHPSRLAAAYYNDHEKNVVISVPHANNGPFGSTMLHEVGHAFKGALEKKFGIYCPSSLYKILELPSSGAFQDTRNDDEFFANLFSFYYETYYYNLDNHKKESFKKDFPESYNFFRKLEALVMERSLQEDWIGQSIEKEEHDKKYGIGRFLEAIKRNEPPKKSETSKYKRFRTDKTGTFIRGKWIRYGRQ